MSGVRGLHQEKLLKTYNILVKNELDGGIPEISFLKPGKGKPEFEVFTLGNLFSRQDKLGFSLEKPHRVNFYHILFVKKGRGIHPSHHAACSLLGRLYPLSLRKDFLNIDHISKILYIKVFSKILKQNCIISLVMLRHHETALLTRQCLQEQRSRLLN
jgi:hypothetical protein